MEPSAIVGLCGSCIGITYRAGKLAHDIHDLRHKFKDVDISLLSVKSQASAIQAVTEILSRWLDNPQVQVDGSLQLQLASILDACEFLLGFIQEHVSKATQSQQKLGFRSRTKYLWNESSLNGYRDMLQIQVQALQLILQCIQLPSHSDRQSLLSRAKSQQAFSKIRDDAASILCLRDTDTCFSRDSIISDRQSTVDLRFDFDHELLSSWVYRLAFSSLVKHKMGAGKQKRAELADSISIMGLHSNKADAESKTTTKDDVEAKAVDSLHDRMKDNALIPGSSKADTDSRGLLPVDHNADEDITIHNDREFYREDCPRLAEETNSQPARTHSPAALRGVLAEYRRKRLGLRVTTSQFKGGHFISELPTLPPVAPLTVGDLDLRFEESGISKTDGAGGPFGRIIKAKNVSFNNRLTVCKTWSAAQYDRTPISCAFFTRLTPTIVVETKMELNNFKKTMLVHPESEIYTHFFKPNAECNVPTASLKVSLNPLTWARRLSIRVHQLD
ncbi:uncharacterized protein K441DRAFT_695011 [Cenococcum geophilum 1.58]|uniref:uncharacterized protein n=1 Tax=Cenococcum geophilum 1.58 TaxID=794803 RepID=UPI00358E2459|nr:hypothetical protein K441DRAFT_695011 [Cenococcum geophilum 1.58]